VGIEFRPPISGCARMLDEISKLTIVRIGNNITYSSLQTIGNGILDSFRGMIEEYALGHHNAPSIDRIDAQLLTMILHEEYGGHTLGITDADLTTDDEDEFYNSIFGGKNPKNDVAVVSTKKLTPLKIDTDSEYDLFIGRTLKVALHEGAALLPGMQLFFEPRLRPPAAALDARRRRRLSFLKYCLWKI